MTYPYWRQVDSTKVLGSGNPWRCTECGRFVLKGWQYSPKPGLTTVCLCDDCVEVLTRD